MGTRYVYENGKVKKVKQVYCISGIGSDEKEKLVRSTMRYACLLKGCPISMMMEIGAEAAAAAVLLSENQHSSLDEALVEFEVEWSPADNKPILFERMIRSLSSEDFVFLACALEARFCREKFGIEVEFERYGIGTGGEGVKGISDGSFLMSYCVPAIGGALAKTFGDKCTTTLGHSSWAKPYEEAATGVGVVLIIIAIVLKDRKPWVSKIMAKSGVMAIAFATLAPLALALPPVAGLIFGLLMASIVVATLAQI